MLVNDSILFLLLSPKHWNNKFRRFIKVFILCNSDYYIAIFEPWTVKIFCSIIKSIHFINLHNFPFQCSLIIVLLIIILLSP